MNSARPSAFSPTKRRSTLIARPSGAEPHAPRLVCADSMRGHGGGSKDNRSAFTMGGSLKILAVDDEPSIVQSMFFIFERPMYEVDSAEGGEGGRACVRGRTH